MSMSPVNTVTYSCYLVKTKHHISYLYNALSEYYLWQFGAVVSDVGQTNEVTLRRTQLVLGWVTVSGFNFWGGKFILV